jgi:uncharacterized protein (TIGR00725 family)
MDQESLNKLLAEKDNVRNPHLKIKICVSGAAETSHCGEGALDTALELGREIARQGAVLVTGATTGFPLWSAKGMKEEGGFSLGLSPAETEREHVEHYGLPIDYMDFIVYTGQGYAGRDILLTRTADAVILGCGRIGTIHEFTVAFEDHKPLGVLRGPWMTDEVIKMIMDNGYRENEMVIFEEDPKVLVEKMIAMAGKSKQAIRAI